jgi:hypothetical protein
MKEQHVVEHLSAFISGNLDEALSQTVKEHLSRCETCRREYASWNAIWEGLGRLPEEQPSQALSTGFYNMLKGYEHAGHDADAMSMRLRGAHSVVHSWFASPGFQVGFALATLVIGLFLGRFLGSGGGDTHEMAQLRDEVRQLGNLLTVSLLQQESASERLKGVSFSQKSAASDAEIVDVLIQTMKYDPNVNVRLAALDALTRDLGQPRVRQEIIRSFPSQNSPLMQAALVDVLVQMHDPESRTVLQEALKKPGLNPSVQKRIKQGVQVQL